MQNDNPLIFPKLPDRDRIAKYVHYDQLYEGDHYAAFSYKVPGEFTKQYKELRYIVANFAGLMSRVVADMLFGEDITIDVKDKNSQDFISNLVHENDLINQLYESSIINSRRGGDVFKIRIGKRNPLDNTAKPEIIIEQVGAEKYFPVFDTKAARNVTTQDVIATTFWQNGKNYPHKETHQPGQITHEIFEYDKNSNKIVSAEIPEDFGFPSIEATKVDRSLVFFIPGSRSLTGPRSAIDYSSAGGVFLSGSWPLSSRAGRVGPSSASISFTLA